VFGFNNPGQIHIQMMLDIDRRRDAATPSITTTRNTCSFYLEKNLGRVSANHGKV
jgi:hypothetical protein